MAVRDMDVRPLLTTQRTVIDPITPEDAPFVLELLNSPGWLQFIGDRGVASEADARQYIEQRFLQSYADHGYGYYRVRSSGDDQSMGICGFTRREACDHPDFGFAFLPQYQGQGYALESARAVLAYGQQNFDLPVLDAITLETNMRSIRLLAQLGFVRQRVIASEAEARLVLYRWQADGFASSA